MPDGLPRLKHMLVPASIALPIQVEQAHAFAMRLAGLPLVFPAAGPLLWVYGADHNPYGFAGCGGLQVVGEVDSTALMSALAPLQQAAWAKQVQALTLQGVTILQQGACALAALFPAVRSINMSDSLVDIVMLVHQMVGVEIVHCRVTAFDGLKGYASPVSLLPACICAQLARRELGIVVHACPGEAAEDAFQLCCSQWSDTLRVLPGTRTVYFVLGS
jgi:hypothetical protein